MICKQYLTNNNSICTLENFQLSTLSLQFSQILKNYPSIVKSDVRRVIEWN